MKNKESILKIFVATIGIISTLIIYKLKFEEKKETKGINVVPTLQDKISNDTVWCPTFQLVWNDLKNEIVKMDIDIQNEMAKNLNKEEFTENMLSDEYYYKKYGLKTIELKKEIKDGIFKKFKQTSDILNDFSWEKDSLNDKENDNVDRYFFYSMLYREFKFAHKFQKLKNNKFKDYSNIRYFGLNRNSEEEIRKQIKVLFYSDADNFALSIKTTSKDEIIYYKTKENTNFKEILSKLKEEENSFDGNKNFSSNDAFMAPYINFKVKKEYTELEGKKFKTSNDETGEIIKAIQTINFEIDEAGGKVKSEGGIEYVKTSLGHEEELRNFYLNDSFILMLKEEEKEVPYLMLKVDDIRKYE